MRARGHLEEEHTLRQQWGTAILWGICVDWISAWWHRQGKEEISVPAESNKGQLCHIMTEIGHASFTAANITWK